MSGSFNDQNYQQRDYNPRNGMERVMHRRKFTRKMESLARLTSPVCSFEARRPSAVLAALPKVGHLVSGGHKRARPKPPGSGCSAVAVEDVVVVGGGEVVQGVVRL